LFAWEVEWFRRAPGTERVRQLLDIVAASAPNAFVIGHPDPEPPLEVTYITKTVTAIYPEIC